MSGRVILLSGIVAALFITAVILLTPGFVCTYVDGGFDVPISLWRDGKPVAPDEIRRVSCTHQGLSGGYPDVIWNELEPSERKSLLREARRENGTYVATVPWSSRESVLGYETSCWQPHSLYVEIELTSGRVVRMICPLADREHKPEIRIDVGE